MTVHFIPHSHNDAGWKETFETYYQNTTSKILTSVVNVLIHDRDKLFHWADFAFFYRWWQDQNEETKGEVKKLVKENRFIFIHGGWVMSDEACPAYKESLLQTRHGLDYINDMFEVRPTIGWQIDSYGSSAITVANLHKLGYDVLITNRILPELKHKLSQGDGFNFFWEGHQVSKDKSESNLLTNILQFFYCLPIVRLDAEFLNTNMASYKTVFYNKEVAPVIDEINFLSGNQTDEYHVMVPIGDDFAFVDAGKVFKHFDELIIQLQQE